MLSAFELYPRWVPLTIAHFRVPESLTFKTRPSAQPFSLWKWVLFAGEWKIISISKAKHLTSIWYKGLGELGKVSQKFPLTYRCLTSQQMVSLVYREGNYQMMKAEVSLGYPKPLAFKYLAAGGGIVPALFPQGITNSLVKYILVFTCKLTLNWLSL